MHGHLHHNPAALQRAIRSGVVTADYPVQEGHLLQYDQDMQAYGAYGDYGKWWQPGTWFPAKQAATAAAQQAEAASIAAITFGTEEGASLVTGLTTAAPTQVFGGVSYTWDAGTGTWVQSASKASGAVWASLAGGLATAVGAITSTAIQAGSQRRMQDAVIEANLASDRMKYQAQSDASRVQAMYSAAPTAGAGKTVAVALLAVLVVGGAGYYFLKGKD